MRDDVAVHAGDEPLNEWREVELGDVVEVLHGFAFKGNISRPADAPESSHRGTSSSMEDSVIEGLRRIRARTDRWRARSCRDARRLDDHRAAPRTHQDRRHVR